jgi:hypothetical protein
MGWAGSMFVYTDAEKLRQKSKIHIQWENCKKTTGRERGRLVKF